MEVSCLQRYDGLQYRLLGFPHLQACIKQPVATLTHTLWLVSDIPSLLHMLLLLRSPTESTMAQTLAPYWRPTQQRRHQTCWPFC